MTTVYVCPCCNRSIYHQPPCRKFEGRRGSAFGWITLALIGMPVAAIAFMLSGCASRNVRPQPSQVDTDGYCPAKCFNYPKMDLSICVTCDERMQRECGRDHDGHWDSGKRRVAGVPVGACFDVDERTIWLNAKDPNKALHEFCHADGSWSDKVCGEEFKWPEGN